MSVPRAARTFTIARILAGLLGAYFVYATIYDLKMVVPELIGGGRLDVVMVLYSQAAFHGVLSVISILFVRRGHLPASNRQAGRGCLFLIVAYVASMFLAALVATIFNLDAWADSAWRLIILYSGGALLGVLGIYVARPSALHQPALPGPLGSAITAALTAIFPSFFGLIFFGWILSLSQCIPPEAASDSGAMRALTWLIMAMWFVSTPLAMLLGALLGYASFRYLNSREIKSNSSLPAILAGEFSGLVFIIINMVVFQMLLCVNKN